MGMLELPDILYKYIPCKSLDYGLPTTLRATQPSALNDVMEGNIMTSMQGKMDRDQWYEIVFGSLKEIFLDDALSADEISRRKNLYGDPRVSTIIRNYLSRFIGVISFSSDPADPNHVGALCKELRLRDWLQHRCNESTLDRSETCTLLAVGS